MKKNQQTKQQNETGLTAVAVNRSCEVTLLRRMRKMYALMDGRMDSWMNARMGEWLVCDCYNNTALPDTYILLVGLMWVAAGCAQHR